MGFIRNLFGTNHPKSKPVNAWITEYNLILASRQLKPKTLEIKNYLIALIQTEMGTKKIGKVSTFDITNLIKIFTVQDKKSMAKCLYHLLKDMFREAYANGWIDQNPTDPIKPPKTPVKRSRMNLREFKKMLQEAQKSKRCSYLYQAMLIAMVTAQRRSDIVTMAKSKIKRNYLLIEQYKTGMRIGIPIKIKCQKLNLSLANIIERTDNNSDYLVNRAGTPVNVRDITQNFARLRDKVFPTGYWKDKQPFTFHEIRSLSERLYREQKIDTRILLGHKSQQTTDLYNDSRGKEYKYLKL